MRQGMRSAIDPCVTNQNIDMEGETKKFKEVILS